jgi:hypothetical protein
MCDLIGGLHGRAGRLLIQLGGRRACTCIPKHNLGVRLTKAYELKEAGDDFFDEDEGTTLATVRSAPTSEANRLCRPRPCHCLFSLPKVRCG